MLFAPGLFSTVTGWFHIIWSRCVTSRWMPWLTRTGSTPTSRIVAASADARSSCRNADVTWSWTTRNAVAI